MMYKFFAGLLLLGLIGVGIVGVSMMGSHSDCFFGKFDSCAADVLAMINAHFGIFQILSAVVFASVIASIILLISLLTLILGFYSGDFLKNIGLGKIYPSFLHNLNRFEEDLYCWLSLHENSPAFSTARI